MMVKSTKKVRVGEGGTFWIIDRYVPQAFWKIDLLMEYGNPKIIASPGVNDVPFAVIHMEVYTC